MKSLSKKGSGKLLTYLGTFLLIAGVFGMYMWASGSDSDAWFSATLMFITGAFFIFVGYRSDK
jgi:hypothetical protein